MDDTTVIVQAETTNVVLLDCDSTMVVSRPARTTVVVTEQITSVVSSFCGQQVPATEISRLVRDFTAGEALEINRIVRLNADEKAIYASQDDLDAFDRAIGITLHGAALDGAVRVLLLGVQESPLFSFASDSRLFLGTEGQMVTTAPTTGFVQQVGKSVQGNMIFISISISVVVG